jgi:hypothetical protein
VSKLVRCISSAPLLILFFHPGLVSQTAVTADLLQRAAAYVTQFRLEFSGIVAEETYVQDIGRSAGSSVDVVSGGGFALVSHRELKSDLLLVRPGGTDRPVDFRDVFAVDGKPVRDRQERVSKLFLDSSASSSQQLNQIITESARFNIGNIYRNVNTPTLALMFLEPEHQGRFQFTQSRETTPALARGWGRAGDRFAMPASAAVVEYQEVQKNTLIRRSMSGGDMPARGRFWIEAPTGRVLATELLIDDAVLNVAIDVRYQPDAEPGLLVPVEMRERYVNNRDRSVITGTANYDRFRRFQVQVGQDIPPVGQKKPR